MDPISSIPNTGNTLSNQGRIPGTFGGNSQPRNKPQGSRTSPVVGGEVSNREEQKRRENIQKFISQGILIEKAGITFKVDHGEIVKVIVPESLDDVSEKDILLAKLTTYEHEMAQMKETIASLKNEANKRASEPKVTAPELPVVPRIATPIVPSTFITTAPIQPTSKVLRGGNVSSSLGNNMKGLPTLLKETMRKPVLTDFNKERAAREEQLKATAKEGETNGDSKTRISENIPFSAAALPLIEEKEMGDISDLDRKHQEMYARDPEKYKQLYQNKSFVYGDPNETAAKKILGDELVREKTDDDMFAEEKAKGNTTLETNVHHYSPVVVDKDKNGGLFGLGRINNHADSRGLTPVGNIERSVTVPKTPETNERTKKVGILEKTLETIRGNDWWKYSVLAIAIGTSSYVPVARKEPTLERGTTSEAVLAQPEKNISWKDALSQEDRELSIVIPKMPIEKLIEAYLPSMKSKLSNPSFLYSLLNLDVYTVVQSEKSVAELSTEERAELSRFIVALERISKGIEGKSALPLTLPAMYFGNYIATVKHQIQSQA